MKILPVGNVFTANDSASNASRKFSLPIEILFEILGFVKFHEVPNIFLVNRYLLPICQVYFHSGTVGQNKNRNVRDLTMELREGVLSISVKRNGELQSVPVPEVDPPKIFNAFANIKIGNCCRIQAMNFLCKFQSLLNKENHVIICARNFFLNHAIADENQFFLNLIEQKELLLELKADATSESVARCLADVPLIAQFNGRLCIKFINERNLCGLEEDAKLIYGWISAAGSRQLGICHYDVQKARELACQIALLFEEAHVNKKEAKRMNLGISLPQDTVVPMHMQKICNGIGDQLATLRTISVDSSNGIYASVYIFYTKPLEYYYENKEELELFIRQVIYFE